MKKLTLLALLYLLSVSCTQTPDSLELKGLKKPVEIYRDNYGIPHIKAKNNEDMMFALGYTMASDRLFQMDLLRRVGSGRLSEIFGEKTFDTDKFLRTLGLHRQMKENWNKFKKTAPKEMIQEIESFINGLNSYVKHGKKPLETRILRYEIEPFTFSESLSVAGYMGLNFAEALTVDVMYSDLFDELNLEDIELIFSRGSKDKNVSNFHSINYNPSPKYYSWIENTTSLLLNEFSLFHGSNSWAIAPNRSKSGQALLANDPHIGFSLPGIWYEAHIKSPDFESYGHYIPLIPFAGLSHNTDRAWGITMAKFNDMDLFQETFDPKNPNRVLYKGKYTNVASYDETIKIKDKEDYILNVRKTPHGPILDDTKHGENLKGIALSWQFLSPDNNPALAFYLLTKSKSLFDLANAIKHATAPSFTITYADSSGNIGYHVMGRIPVLAEGFNGKYIFDGATGAQDYQGYLSIDENPHSYNPESGLIVNANHKLDYKTKKNVGGMFLSHKRHRRIREILDTKEKWSLEELKKVQLDTTVYNFKKDYGLPLSLIKPQTEAQQDFLKRLKAWNGEVLIDTPEGTLFYGLQASIIRAILFDELGETRYEEYISKTDMYSFLKYIYEEPESKLWDNKNTEAVEDMKTTLQTAFEYAATELSKKFGDDIENWSWEKAHTLNLKHPLGSVFPLNHIFNLGPYPAHGGGSLVNNMRCAKEDLEFNVKYGPSTRRLIDFANLDNSLGVLPAGNSGNPFSKYYDDQVKLFNSNQYRPQLMDFKDIEKVSKKTELLPN